MTPVMTPLVRARDLVKHYGGQHTPPAVDRVSFDIARGKTLALVGESGSGKSTVGRMILQLETVTAGEVFLDDICLTRTRGAALRALRPRMQMVFQDPFSALDPRMRIGDAVGEPLDVHRRLSREDRRERTAALLRRVGLDPAMMDRLPHAFSGGQRQRINIARALALAPDFIVADEPITALDVSIQAQIVNLLKDIQADTQTAFLFISHDLGMVRHLSDRVAVMRFGRLVELADTAALFEDARHPYTRALLSAAPLADPRLERARVQVPFDPRWRPCADAQWIEAAPGHWVLEEPR